LAKKFRELKGHISWKTKRKEIGPPGDIRRGQSRGDAAPPLRGAKWTPRGEKENIGGARYRLREISGPN